MCGVGAYICGCVCLYVCTHMWLCVFVSLRMFAFQSSPRRFSSFNLLPLTPKQWVKITNTVEHALFKILQDKNFTKHCINTHIYYARYISKSVLSLNN